MFGFVVYKRLSGLVDLNTAVVGYGVIEITFYILFIKRNRNKKCLISIQIDIINHRESPILGIT